jgi:hypothetical protein
MLTNEWVPLLERLFLERAENEESSKLCPYFYQLFQEFLIAATGD